LKETEKDYNNQRLNYTKKLAEEIRYLLEKRLDVSYKLSNALAQNSVAYAVVHSSDGTILARSEGYALPVGIFEIAEVNALKAEFLTLTPFKDPSGRYSLVEASLPVFTNEGIRYVLRLGFFRTSEEEKLTNLKLRNTLIFSLIFIFFISVRNLHYFSSLNLRYVLLISMTLVMVLLFFVSSFFIRKWFDSAWRDNFISNECISLSKMLIPCAVNMIEKGSFSDIQSYVEQLEENKDFETLSIIKDEVYVYHTDPSKIGVKASGEYYRCSLNTDKCSVFKMGGSEDYIAMIPVVNGKNRIGTICTIWKNYNAFESFSSLRNNLTLVFVFAYVLLYWFISQFSKEFSSLSSNKANYRECVNLFDNSSSSAVSDSKDLSDNIQTAVSVFIYFSGIGEAVGKIDKDSLNQSIEGCFTLAKTLLNGKSSHNIKFESDGIVVLFNDKDEQKSIYEAVEFSKALKNELNKQESLPFSPKITLHTCRLIYVADSKSGEDKNNYFGDSKIDYKTIAKVQARNDIIVSAETYNLLKDLVNFEALEILSLEQGKYNVYVMLEFKESKELFEKYDNSSDWTKQMILRILKGNGTVDKNLIDELVEKTRS
ncbi:MAG: hypothetical protein IKP71_01115, partial [Candidatus Riflebacteria bacterium]|nr:hypothetical protein [Candidatus Riflebacteria bacterium]